MTIPSDNCPSFFLCSTAGCCSGVCHADNGPTPSPVGDRAPSSVSGRVYKAVADQAGYPAELLTDETALVAALGMDSLDLVELVMALEDEFDIEMPDEACAEFERARTVGQVVEFIQTHQQQWKNPPQPVSALAPVLARANQIGSEMAVDLSGHATQAALSCLLQNWRAADSCQDPAFSKTSMLDDIDKVINKLTTLKAELASEVAPA